MADRQLVSLALDEPSLRIDRARNEAHLSLLQVDEPTLDAGDVEQIIE